MAGPSSGASPQVATSSGEGLRDPAEVLATRRLLPRSGSSPALNRLAELAARVLGSRAAQVSLLADEQLVAGGAGLAAAAVGTRGRLEDSLCTVTAASRAPLVVTEARSDHRVAELPPVAAGAVGAYLGVPLVAHERVVGALCVFDPEPRAWSQGDLVVLQQLAASAAAELELSALSEEFGTTRARWELAIDAAGIGSFDYDLASGEVGWDERMDELFGLEPGAFDRTIEGFYARLHPEDRPRVVGAVEDAIARRGSYEAEYRAVRPDGEERWVQARGRVLSDQEGRPVRLLGAAYDTTVVRQGEARVLRLLETMSVGFVHVDRQWRVAYVNAEAERVLGLRRDALVGGLLWELFPALVGTPAEQQYRRAMEHGEPVTFDAYYPEPLNAWYEVRAWPGPDGLSVYFLDITDRRAAQEQSERAAARSALLARVASELSATLDAEEAVARLARLVVPVIADWCVVTLVDDDGDARRSLRDLASWHVDPDLRPVVQRYAELRLRSLDEQSLLTGPLATGEPFVLRSAAAERVAAGLGTEEARGLLRRLAPEVAAVVPLRAHGRSLGLLTLARSRGSTAGPGLDLDTALDVAARAGLSLDNVRLYQQQRRLAEGLQRALLTPPPQPDGVQIVVRYEPAGEAAQVGGDWYDAFRQPDGATTVVIGDVVGHDTEAAAAMGQVRGLLRGIAATTAGGPAEVLTRLDAAIELLDVGTTATAVVARLEPAEAERAGGPTRLRWSNAGHPPPLLLEPDGTVAVLAAPDADLLLGIDPAVPRGEAERVLRPGETVLFYTDGLVERRGQSLDEGIAALVQVLRGLADCDLDTLCDSVLTRMAAGRAEDDVALTAVRLHPQHRGA